MDVTQRALVDGEFEDDNLYIDGMTPDHLTEEEEYMPHDNIDREDNQDVNNTNLDDGLLQDISKRLKKGLKWYGD